MKLGDVDVLRSVLQLEQDVLVLQKAMAYITRNNRNINMPSRLEIERFKDEATEKLKKKYPNMGITRRKG